MLMSSSTVEHRKYRRVSTVACVNEGALEGTKDNNALEDMDGSNVSTESLPRTTHESFIHTVEARRGTEESMHAMVNAKCSFGNPRRPFQNQRPLYGMKTQRSRELPPNRAMDR